MKKVIKYTWLGITALIHFPIFIVVIFWLLTVRIMNESLYEAMLQGFFDAYKDTYRYKKKCNDALDQMVNMVNEADKKPLNKEETLEYERLSRT